MIEALNLVTSRPWHIQADALENIMAIAQRQGDVEALQTRVGHQLENTRRVTVRDGVAVVPVTGPIFRYANLFTAISGATSTQVLATDIQEALDNRFVRAIVLDFNTPGGEATGIQELADFIFANRKRKPIKAYGGGSMASAGYWLGSAASEIIVAPTAIVGSIGTVMSWMDTRERDAKAGIRQVEIVSSQSPYKRLDTDSDEGRAKVQAIVDALTDVFVGAVAKHRDISTETVLSDYGQGGVLVGQSAVDAGMADRIGSLESVIAELAGSASAPGSRRTSMSGSNNKQVTVSTTEDLRQALAAGHTADQITIASSDDAIKAAREEGEQAGRKATHDDAIKAERKRVLDIQALVKDGFQTEAQAAIEAGDSPEAFALAMVKAANDRGITLDAIRKDAPKAAPKGNTNASDQKASWDSVVAKLGGK